MKATDCDDDRKLKITLLIKISNVVDLQNNGVHSPVT